VNKQKKDNNKAPQNEDQFQEGYEVRNAIDSTILMHRDVHLAKF